jgi:hypothetical protein
MKQKFTLILLTYLGSDDTTLKRNGKRLWETEDWNTVGKDNEGSLSINGIFLLEYIYIYIYRIYVIYIYIFS